MQNLTMKIRQPITIMLFLLGILGCMFVSIQILGAERINIAFISMLAVMFAIFLLTGSPFRTLLALVISIPLGSTMSIEIGFRIIPAYLLLLLLIFIMVVTKDFWYTKSPMDLSVFIFLAVCALSLVQSVRIPPPRLNLAETMRYRGMWFRSVIQFMLLFFFSLVYFFTVHLCSKNRKRLDILIKTYLTLAIILSIYGLYQIIAVYFRLPFRDITNTLNTGGRGYGNPLANTSFKYFRVYSVFMEPLGFGHYLLSVIPLVLPFAVITRDYIDLNNRKWISAKKLMIFIAIFFVCMFFTRSRGALVSFVFTLMLILVLLRRKNFVRFAGYMFASLIVVMIFYLLAIRFLGVNANILKMLRFGNIVEAFDIENFNMAMEAGIKGYRSEFGKLISSQRFIVNFYLIPQMFSRYPILGVGLGNFPLHASAILRSRMLYSPVGIWGNMLAETGIIGLGAFCWMVFTYYRIMIKTLGKVRDTYWEPYIIGFTACFTGFIFHYFFWGARLMIPDWLFIGMSMALVNSINMQINRDKTVNTEHIKLQNQSQGR
ncbi:hypothetical protein GF312_09835 [Candidatus Poribacteria bacterium]|nr:hypothetical protein [Candidatus Poribacteria bacterium]